MSDEGHQFKQGTERGKAGKSEEYGLLETDLFDSEASRAARRRGYEAGLAARATADAIQEQVSRSSSGSSIDPQESNDKPFKGLVALFFEIPLGATMAGIAAYLLGTLAAYLGRTVVASAAKSLGASRPTVDRILTADPWAVGGVIGWLTFWGLLAYLIYGWFKDNENRRTFVRSAIAVAVIAGLISAWKFLSNYAAT